MTTQRRTPRKSMTEDEIRVVVIQEDESVLLSGRLIDLSFEGLAVALDTDLDLNGRDVLLGFPEHLRDVSLTGRVVSHDRSDGGVVRIFLSALSQPELTQLLRLYYPTAGRQQIETIARELRRRIFLEP